MAPHEWDSRAYDALPLPHEAWGQRVIDRLDPAPGARVLDAGCGTGRDAAALLEDRTDVSVVVRGRLPRGGGAGHRAAGALR